MPKSLSAIIAIVLLMIFVIAKVAGFVTTLEQFQMLTALRDGDPSFTMSMAEIKAADARHELVGEIRRGITLLCIIAVAIWTYIAAWENEKRSEAVLDYSPALSVGSYFIPIANYFLPFVTMSETYRASIAGKDYITVSLPYYFLVWWLGWLGFNILGSVTYLMTARIERTRDIDYIINYVYVQFASIICGIIAALTLSWIIAKISNAQHQRKLSLGAIPTQ